MASRSTRKTWETAFLLSASMSQSYQQTFAQAQSILHDLGIENVQLGDEAERAAQRQENAFNLMAAALAETGLVELLGKVKEAYTDVIEVTEEFEFTMSAVRAISGAGSDEIGQLTDKARELGETTVYTAQQSAEAMTYIAQAGWDTGEMLEGMSGLISLAAASGTDLAESANITADTLAGFGMKAEETTRLANVLAQTASHTNTNVSLMGETFANSAAIAGALGFEIEDVSVMLGLMANAGVKGSRAGTTLRNIFNGLAKDVTLTAEAFGEADFSMFNDDGSAKGLVDSVRELRTYFAQMTDQEKYLNASNIAGLRGYNGLLAILNATDEQFEELYEDINASYGAAERMARIRMDNLKGDVTLLNSAFESLKITIGEHFMPAGRGVTQWLTKLTQDINSFAETCPGLVHTINDIVSAMGGAMIAVTVAGGILKLRAAFATLFSFIGPGGWAIAGLGALVGLLASISIYYADLNQVTSELLDAAEAHKEFARALAEQDTIRKENAAAIEQEAKDTLYLEDKLMRLSKVQDKTAAQKKEILGLVELLNEKVPDLALAYDEETDSLNRTTDAIMAQIRAELEKETLEEKMSELKERMRNQSAIQREYDDALQEYNKAKSSYEYYKDIWNRVYTEDGTVKEDIRKVAPGMKAYELREGLNLSYSEYQETEKALHMLRAQKEKNDALVDLTAAEISEIENRIYGEQPEVEEEQAGQEEIRKAAEDAQQAAEDAGMDYADMKDLLLGNTDSADIVNNNQYNTTENRYDAAKPAEGAVLTQNGGDSIVTVNVNVAGNMTEDTVPDVEKAAREAAEKVIAYISRAGMNRVRLAFN